MINTIIVSNEESFLIQINKQIFLEILAPLHLKQIQKQTAFIQSFQIFRPIDDYIYQLNYYFHEICLQKGQTVYKQGDKVNELFLIKSGEVELIQQIEQNLLKKGANQFSHNQKSGRDNEQETIPSDVEFDEKNQIFHQKLDLQGIKKEKINEKQKKTNFVISKVSEGSYFGDQELVDNLRFRNHDAVVNSNEIKLLAISRQNFLLLCEYNSLWEEMRQQNKIKKQWHKQSFKNFIQFQAEKIRYQKELKNSQINLELNSQNNSSNKNLKSNLSFDNQTNQINNSKSSHFHQSINQNNKNYKQENFQETINSQLNESLNQRIAQSLPSSPKKRTINQWGESINYQEKTDSTIFNQFQYKSQRFQKSPQDSYRESQNLNKKLLQQSFEDSFVQTKQPQKLVNFDLNEKDQQRKLFQQQKQIIKESNNFLFQNIPNRVTSSRQRNYQRGSVPNETYFEKTRQYKMDEKEQQIHYLDINKVQKQGNYQQGQNSERYNEGKRLQFFGNNQEEKEKKSNKFNISDGNYISKITYKIRGANKNSSLDYHSIHQKLLEIDKIPQKLKKFRGNSNQQQQQQQSFNTTSNNFNNINKTFSVSQNQNSFDQEMKKQLFQLSQSKEVQKIEEEEMKNYHNFHKIYHKLNIKRIFSPNQTKIKFFDDSLTQRNPLNNNFYESNSLSSTKYYDMSKKIKNQVINKAGLMRPKTNIKAVHVSPKIHLATYLNANHKDKCVIYKAN